MITTQLPLSDGTKLRLGRWEPGPGAVCGSVLLLQGREEFLEKYNETAADFVRRGWRVVSFDWRGQGLSTRALPQRQRGYVKDYRLYLDDLDAVIHHALPPDGKPILLFAHSMGGHIALRYLLEGNHARHFRGAILCSPMLNIHARPFPSVLARGIARLAVVLGLGSHYAPTQGDYSPAKALYTPANRLTTDPKRFAMTHQFIALNPDLALGGATYGWLDATFRSIKALTLALKIQAKSLSLPILILSTPQDRVVCAGNHEGLAQALPRAEIHHYPDGQHELMMESDGIRARIWRDLDVFIAKIMASPPR